MSASEVTGPVVTEETPEVVAAAEWWRRVIMNPKFDNGDPSEGGVVSAMMATVANTANRHPPEAYDKFERSLRRLLAEQINMRPGAWQPGNPTLCSQLRVLKCDYEPCETLALAAREAGLGDGITDFPWKTVMWVNPGHVEVRYGYGAPITTIYPKA